MTDTSKTTMERLSFFLKNLSAVQTDGTLAMVGKNGGLNHRQFQEFLKVMGTEFIDACYYTEVRWLSKGQMLKRFYNLRTEIIISMETQGKPVTEFEGKDEGCRFSFFSRHHRTFILFKYETLGKK